MSTKDVLCLEGWEGNGVVPTKRQVILKVEKITQDSLRNFSDPFSFSKISFRDQYGTERTVDVTDEDRELILRGNARVVLTIQEMIVSARFESG